MLARTHIEGRQVSPAGEVLRGTTFATNLADHPRILETDVMKQHARTAAPTRHVN